MTIAVPQFETLIAPSHWRTVDFISDLHLHPGDTATCAAWQHYLQKTPADAVLMLGDLFEVWVGDDALQAPGSFEAQCAATLQAASQRLALFFMAGNRDFLVGTAFAHGGGVQLLADPTLFCWQGQRLLLSHGDALCLDDVDYQRFRLLARSAAWQAQFLAQPLATRRVQARNIRQESEARKQSGANYADVDSASAIAWLQATEANILIHGHTHRPAEHLLTPNLQRIVLTDWDAAAQPARAQALRLDADGLHRIALA